MENQTPAIDVEEMARHYITAALWADSDEGTNPRATKQSFQKAVEICTLFAEYIKPHWQALLDCDQYGAHPDAGSTEAALGHDLWLTSRGHGTGFWDRDELTQDLRDYLTAIVDKHFKHPQYTFYRGWLYIH